MKSKTKNGLILFFVTLFLGQNAFTQDAMLKGAAFTLGYGYISFDAGVEVKLNKHISLELSYSTSKAGIENIHSKNIWSLQSRYYPNGEKWYQSPFVGVVLQNLLKEDNTEAYIDTKFRWTTVKADKRALGVIVGKNFKRYKRLGLDIHGGFVGQIGDETSFHVYSNNAKPNETTYRKNVVNTRPFWGINLSIAIGSLSPKSEVNEKTIDNEQQ